MNSRNRDKIAGPLHYSRAQFLSDVAWMGLDSEQGFSPKSLRRQRDRLMHIHHPDRGGSEEMAARINITYSRMLGWLEKRLHHRNNLRMRREMAFAREVAKNAETPPEPLRPKRSKARIYAAILGTAAAAMGIGLSSLARRRR